MCWRVHLIVYLITAFYESSSIELCEIRSELLFCVVVMLSYCVEYLTFLEMYQDFFVRTCTNAQQCINMTPAEAQVCHFICESTALCCHLHCRSIGPRHYTCPLGACAGVVGPGGPLVVGGSGGRAVAAACCHPRGGSAMLQPL